MIPARYSHFVFCFLLSGMMSLLVTCIATLRTFGAGTAGEFTTVWMGSWLPSWLVAYPAVLMVAPVARRITARLTS